jgi:hypothetical protein
MSEFHEGNVLFLGLSWEERCFLGVKEDYKRFNQTSKVFIICNERSNDDDRENREKIEDFFSKRNVLVHFVLLNYDNPIASWKNLEELINENRNILKKPVIDITTLPRELTWILFYFIRKYTARVAYVYHSPETYSSDWISKEPGTPRLVLKHSGITDLHKSTAVVLITGFDEIRTRKLVEYFEPKLVLLGIQSGDSFDNTHRNSKQKHEQVIKGQTQVKTFLINAFSGDQGLSTLNKELKTLSDFNVIACSQGPKPSLISLYRSYLLNPEVALCYVPSKQYNKDYSKGLKETFKGEIEF